jgi:hypothetical protein
VTPEQFFRNLAREELAKAEALVPPPRSNPVTSAELRMIVSTNCAKLPHLSLAYLSLAEINDPLRQAVRDQAHLLMDVIFDACEEVRTASR